MLKLLLHILLLGIGAGVGYLYYHYIGCRSGSCAIASNAWSSVIFGAVIIWLAFSPFIRQFVPKPPTSNIEQGR